MDDQYFYGALLLIVGVIGLLVLFKGHIKEEAILGSLGVMVSSLGAW